MMRAFMGNTDNFNDFVRFFWHGGVSGFVACTKANALSSRYHAGPLEQKRVEPIRIDPRASCHFDAALQRRCFTSCKASLERSFEKALMQGFTANIQPEIRRGQLTDRHLKPCGRRSRSMQGVCAESYL